MNEEIESLHKNGTWSLVKPPSGKRIIGYKWIFKKKDDIPRVEDARYKARLVAKGYSQLESEFEMKDLGAAKKILGMEIKRDRKANRLFLTQKKYLEKVLERFGMKDVKPVSTPLAAHFKLSVAQSPQSEEEERYMAQVPYSSAVGSIMYAIVYARPDISQALSVASVLHHEAFLRIREEHEAEVRNLTKKSDFYKLLSEKLRADLTTAREEHEEMAEQVRQRIEQIRLLNSQVDGLLAEAEEFKKNMDILASKKEVVQSQLELSEAQLRSAKENASGLIERMKELQHRLDLAISDKASLADELEVARSEVIEANKRVDAKVAQFRIDVEINQAKAKSMVEHAKWQARREVLEEVSAQGFDVGAKIKISKAEENKARRLAFPEEDSDSSSEYKCGKMSRTRLR
ncbi:uncharacterized protein [Nicotiana tomentosiformis]|uniref:uncharacterized protein n=1 Tax=Nicotiana tomentosiformis TaxID=4098 RepID=UPI00388CC250